MKITRLRLTGFKSFVEPTDLVIERGLTGVVGPNGCGKSNLLEALRWVMGETSHKSMRAAAMDDVIFNGTTNRPPRDSAEVSIFLDNSERKALAEFNDADVLQIARRIEREMGSAYRINSREVRARDVKLLFEDAATGARSPALVRQGQISELVNAKPEQRRRVLEDAAGVAGLHSRRHEAELRLKGAENNLARLSDLLGQLTSQIESMKRQARAARRYKEISTEIRRTEAVVHHLTWLDVQAQVTSEEAALLEGERALAAATEAESKALREEAECAEALPPLRDEEATRAAAFARLKIEQDGFEREAKRAAERQAELESRRDQLEADLRREKGLITEARETIARLDAELAGIAEADAGAEDAAAAACDLVEAADADLARDEAALNDITRVVFEERARRKSLETNLAERLEQKVKLERQLTALDMQAREISARAPDIHRLTSTEAEGQRLLAEVQDLERAQPAAEERVRTAAAEAKVKREANQKAGLLAEQLKTELATLSKFVLPAGDGAYPPILDQIKVAPGFEMALGAALGDDLDAPVAEDAPIHWRSLDAALVDVALPSQADPLVNHVEAPLALRRRLKQIGVVDRSAGARLQPFLKGGQRLVSREGDLWRWDGFVAAADAPSAAAQRLAERNRLASLIEREAQVRLAAEEAAVTAATAAETLRRAEDDERSVRQRWREAQADLGKTREVLTLIERAARETEARLAAVADARSTAEEGLLAEAERIDGVTAALELMSEAASREPELERAQSKVSASRAKVAETRARLASLEREHQIRQDKAKSLTADRERWAQRTAGAEQQIAALEQRQTETVGELGQFDGLADQIEEHRQRLLTSLSEAERARQMAADAVTAQDIKVRQAAQALRLAQSDVAKAREDRVRTETKLDAARQRRLDEGRKIQETMGVAPEACLAVAMLEPGADMPSLVDADRSLIRLKADRERLGGVNLQADDELTVLQQQFDGMDKERADVDEAIGKLRGGIAQLNREAKKRLNEAFEQVNAHFQRLFTTLFNGGEARLEMIESEEDPLEGGLEIIAKPPGKKPATLSLLSGGEQTLTALSLIFAVFLTNPSPICVLDEVDAPLDDANVDRFCTLMEKMAEETDTRFLVITHHPMTMARMNRLFGVTMGEKGVSQLVSVDLRAAEKLVESSIEAAE
jgi:chromosome segregation protein